MRRLDTIMKGWGGFAPGLASFRLAIVVAIVLFQSAEVSESWTAVVATPLWIVQTLSMPALFAATGFLLSGLRRRSGRLAMVTGRVRRIAPSLVIMAVATALVLGPLLTNLGTRNYLSDQTTWAYFLNLLAVPVYELPGVFEFNNVSRMVNPVVGTFPFYLTLLATALALPSKDRGARLLVGTLIMGSATAAICVRAFDLIATDQQGLLSATLAGPGFGLVLAGWCGMLIDRFRARIRIGSLALAGAASMVGVIGLIGTAALVTNPFFWIIAAPVTAFATISLAMTPLPFSAFAARVQPVLLPTLLFAYPLQQAAIDRGPRGQSFILNLAIILVPLILASASVWWLATRHISPPFLAAPAAGPSNFTTTNPARTRRALRSRLADAVIPLVLIAAIAVVMIVVMGMLFLALSRES